MKEQLVHYFAFEAVGRQYGELVAAANGLDIDVAVNQIVDDGIAACPAGTPFTDVLNKAVELVHGSFGFVKA